MERVMNATLGGLRGLDGNSLGARLFARILAGLRRLLRAPAASDAALHIEARVSLGPKKSLVLVNCCGKYLLMAVSGDTIVPVADVPKQRRAKQGLQKEAVR